MWVTTKGLEHEIVSVGPKRRFRLCSGLCGVAFPNVFHFNLCSSSRDVMLRTRSPGWIATQRRSHQPRSALSDLYAPSPSSVLACRICIRYMSERSGPRDPSNGLSYHPHGNLPESMRVPYRWAEAQRPSSRQALLTGRRSERKPPSLEKSATTLSVSVSVDKVEKQDWHSTSRFRPRTGFDPDSEKVLPTVLSDVPLRPSTISSVTSPSSAH